jgi:predicted MFS family arabinose efflux permease
VRLVASRDFGALLAGSVIPFSVVQVGLLYFALPISLEAQGVPAADVGRILMAYGLCAICLGPSVGRLVDRAPNKRLFIPLGGLAGGGGLAYLYLDSSLPAIIAAVFLLSLAGCLVQAAQSSYALALPRVQSYGPGFAFGVQRAADKLGQMLGPLVIGLMIAAVGTANALAIVGLSYLTATLVFFLVTPRTTAGEAAEAPALATEEPLRRAA